MNVNMIKLPLIRVAHPSGEECQKEYEKIKAHQDGKAGSPAKKDDLNFSDTNVRIEAPGAASSYNPTLFNFEHPYDPELTPRKAWKAKVSNIDSLLT